MRKRLWIFPFIAGLCVVQGVGAQTCPAIKYTYDEAGNRIQRKTGTISCFSNPVPDSVKTIIAKVYPNPSQDKVNIMLQKDETADESETVISLYDMMGRELYSTQTTSLQMQIDVSQFGAGCYLLRVVRGTNRSMYTISKN